MRKEQYERAELTIKVGFIKRVGLSMREQDSAPGSRAQETRWPMMGTLGLLTTREVLDAILATTW